MESLLIMAKLIMRPLKNLERASKNDRGEVELFNRGGTIDEIKAKAIEETNLEPPVSP